MVINLRIFEKSENFVQPAEIPIPICSEIALLEPFSGQKRQIFWVFDVCFFFFEYEYAKIAKLPFEKAGVCEVEREVWVQVENKNDRKRQCVFGRWTGLG